MAADRTRDRTIRALAITGGMLDVYAGIHDLLRELVTMITQIDEGTTSEQRTHRVLEIVTESGALQNQHSRHVQDLLAIIQEPEDLASRMRDLLLQTELDLAPGKITITPDDVTALLASRESWTQYKSPDLSGFSFAQRYVVTMIRLVTTNFGAQPPYVLFSRLSVTEVIDARRAAAWLLDQHTSLDVPHLALLFGLSQPTTRSYIRRLNRTVDKVMAQRLSTLDREARRRARA